MLNFRSSGCWFNIIQFKNQPCVVCCHLCVFILQRYAVKRVQFTENPRQFHDTIPGLIVMCGTWVPFWGLSFMCEPMIHFIDSCIVKCCNGIVFSESVSVTLSHCGYQFFIVPVQLAGPPLLHCVFTLHVKCWD